MSDENKTAPNGKKGFSGNFFLFLMLGILVVMVLQNFMSGKVANVAFSYQLEHLVNLGLINPEESRKIAVTNQLVIFSGRFLDEIPKEGKVRYKYLSTLNKYH